jgi:predicted Na+-dependent transporter
VGILIGIWQPVKFETPKYLPKILLGGMLFFVFLKIDALEIIEKMRNFKLMIYIALVYMIIIPVLFFLLVNIFDRHLALGILLLTAMPAGVSSPALTDLLKGNISLAMSIVIVTQVIKKYFPAVINRTQHLFTSANVFLLFAFVYVAISSQRNIILNNPVNLIWKTSVLYLVFIILHAIGYTICYRESKENKIAMSITCAYMNNGLAIVLASTYFGPGILVLMVLSEIPWNTLLGPFKRMLRYL